MAVSEGTARSVVQISGPHVLDAIAEATQQAAMRVGNPVTGDAAAKLQMFTEIAATYARVKINGWDDVPKCKYACFLGDAYLVHPAIIMSRSWCLTLKGGKLGWKPMWDFTVDMMSARLPGFRFEVLKDTADAVEVRMTLGKNSHTVSYTMADAQRQGIAGKDAWMKNTREMLMAKAVDRCAKRIGGGVWSGLMPPVVDDEEEVQQPTAKASAPPSAALASAAKGTAFDPALADAPKALSEMIDKLWNGGKPMDKAKKLEKCSMIYGQMAGAPMTFTRYDAISPGDAKQMLDFLQAKYPDGTAGNGGAATPAPSAPAPEPEMAGEADAEAVGTEAPPAVEPEEIRLDPSFEEFDRALTAPPLVEPEAEAAPARDAEDRDGRVETIFLLAARAKKSRTIDRVDSRRGALSKRTFVKEIAEGSGRFYFCDLYIAKDLGYATSPLLQEGGEQAISEADCRVIVRELRRAGVE